jgi:hypothetical protein
MTSNLTHEAFLADVEKMVFVWEGRVSSDCTNPDNWLHGKAPTGYGDEVVIPVHSGRLGKCST